MGIHHTIAYFREEPHWLLSEPDAQAYARYLHNAMRHLPVSVAQKYVDFVALGGAFVVYSGGRIVRSMQLAGQIPQQQQQQQQRPVPPGGAQVFQFVANPAAAGAETVGGEGGGLEPEIPLTSPPDQTPAA